MVAPRSRVQRPWWETAAPLPAPVPLSPPPQPVLLLPVPGGPPPPPEPTAPRTSKVLPRWDLPASPGVTSNRELMERGDISQQVREKKYGSKEFSFPTPQKLNLDKLRWRKMWDRYRKDQGDVVVRWNPETGGTSLWGGNQRQLGKLPGWHPGSGYLRAGKGNSWGREDPVI